MKKVLFGTFLAGFFSIQAHADYVAPTPSVSSQAAQYSVMDINSLIKSAKSGQAGAQFYLATKYQFGKDIQKDEFLDTVTHELRTPITAIRAASEILYDDNDIPEELRKQFLQNIISESDRLNRLIDKILDLEKFETGKQKIYLSKNNITKTIKNTLGSLQQLIKNKNISVQFDNSNKEIRAFYDEERIVQVIHNLLSNAIKFCSETDGKIVISVDENKDNIEVKIHNNGKGIKKEDFEAIFDKFYQSRNQNIKKPIGSGLGLAICKQIIEHHKGKIWTEISKTSGATFIFTLPNYNTTENS